MAIEVFKTNVETQEEAELVLVALNACFGDYQVNFDLDDVDKILRVRARREVAVENLMSLVRSLGFEVEVLPDLPPSLDSLLDLKERSLITEFSLPNSDSPL